MKISLSQPDITNLERKAIEGVLKTPDLALGPKTQEFEKRIAKFVGVKYAVAVNSGTSALHLIIRALDIKDNDEVITTPFSFISSANCILFERAKPIFVDINSKTFNIDVEKIEEKITKKTKAILAIDVFGNPADWDKLKKVAKKHKLFLIEDSAEALGSEYKNQKCGSFGDAGIFGFYPNKQITTGGEGGIVVTNNKKIADKCRSMSNQGRKHDNNKWLEHICLGYNYRMPEICAAMGIAQIKRIKEILKKRAKVAEMYNAKIKNFSGVEIPFVSSDVKKSYFVYVILVSERYSGIVRDKIIARITRKGIECSDYFQPIHLQPFYKDKFGYKKGDFPITENISQRTIALPFYNNLKQNQINYIVKILREVF